MSQIDKLLGVARAELGTKYADGGNSKYIMWFGGFALNVPWCAIFVSWCANQAGVATSIIPKYASCDLGMEWFKKRNLFKLRGAYVPKKGDIIFFGVPTDSNHTGIVESCDGRKVHTIEGNTSRMVARRVYDLTSTRIIGYGVPVYTEGPAPKPTKPGKESSYVTWLKTLQTALGVARTGKNDAATLAATPTLKRGSKGVVVKLVQDRLIEKGISVGKHGADGSFGPGTEAAVITFQKTVVGLAKPDGIITAKNKTWKELLKQ